MLLILHVIKSQSWFDPPGVSVDSKHAIEHMLINYSFLLRFSL
jgi:hypothetical protein